MLERHCAGTPWVPDAKPKAKIQLREGGARAHTAASKRSELRMADPTEVETLVDTQMRKFDHTWK